MKPCIRPMEPIGFIGAGIVGTALGVKLSEAGYPVKGVVDPVPEAVERFLRSVPHVESFASAQELADGVSFVFITTPDDLITQVTSGVRWRKGHRVVHTSGAASLDVLEPAKRAGAEVGSFHPCQTFASVEQALKSLPGSTFAIEASSPLREVLQKMAEKMGCSWIHLDPGDKALYHTAAVFASNYFVTLVGIAGELLGRLGVPSERAPGILVPLLEGTLRNIRELGLPRCLTGPVARGDLGTIGKHCQALKERAPELLGLYCQLALRTKPIAVAKGTLSEEKAEKLAQILKTFQREVQDDED